MFDGVEYPVDCIIYATGFEVGTDYARRAGYDMFGRDGLSLTQKWSTGMRTMHGMQTRGFPNLFIMGPQQGAFTVNYPHLLDEQAKHITYILKHATENKIKTFEPSEEAESQWVDTIIAFSRMGRGVPRLVHAGLLQQRGQPLEPERAEQLLRRRLDPVLPDAAAVARRRDLEGAGAPDLNGRAVAALALWLMLGGACATSRVKVLQPLAEPVRRVALTLDPVEGATPAELDEILRGIARPLILDGVTVVPHPGTACPS